MEIVTVRAGARTRETGEGVGKSGNEGFIQRTTQNSKAHGTRQVTTLMTGLGKHTAVQT